MLVSLGMGSQMAECWIQFIDLFPRGATRCKKPLNKPKPNNPQNKTTLFCLLVQELRPFVFPNCNPLRWRLKRENSGSSSHKTETRDWTLLPPIIYWGRVSFFLPFPSPSLAKSVLMVQKLGSVCSDWSETGFQPSPRLRTKSEERKEIWKGRESLMDLEQGL